MTTLACTVSQKSLTKNFIIQSMERKKIEQIKGRISRRRLVCNPTIQHVIINLYTKYDSCSLQGCGEIFDEKVLRNYGRTDGRTDGMTDRCKPVYPPLFQSGGIIIPNLQLWNFSWDSRTSPKQQCYTSHHCLRDWSSTVITMYLPSY